MLGWLSGVLLASSAFGANPDADVELDRALGYHSAAEVAAAVARGADLGRRDMFGNTPLHRAAEVRRADHIRALLAGGADPNARNQSGQTPLHRLIRGDERAGEAIDALLAAAGLNLEAVDNDGRTVLHLASGLADPARAGRLMAMGAKDSVFAAASRGDVTAVARALDAGADVNGTLPDWATPLRLAAECGRVAAVRELVRRGAKLDLPTDSYGTTALMAAAGKRQLASVEAMLDLGADPNSVDSYRLTFLDRAVMSASGLDGPDQGQADRLTERVLADPRAEPDLRAVALLRRADVARGAAAAEDGPAKDPKAAEALYRRAARESPRSRAGIVAAWRLGEVLKGQGRLADAAAAFVPLLVEDVTQPGPPGGAPRVVWSPVPDYRHEACMETAACYDWLGRHPEALDHARLARGKFRYKSNCGTGLTEYLQYVDDQVRTLEAKVNAARRGVGATRR